MNSQSDRTACQRETTYGPSTLRIVVVSVNRKYGHGDIQVWIFVIDCGETWCSGSILEGLPVDLRWSGGGTYDVPGTFPSSGSLRSST